MKNMDKKFYEVLLKYNLISESEFVKKTEDSELPDSSDISDQPDVDDDTDLDSDEVSDQDLDGEDNFTQREINMLDTAIKLHFNNPNVDLETRNELEELQRNDKYDDLFKRLISIADGYEL